MNINHIKYFQAVCRNNNSITKAAEELLIAQPSISGAIQELEKEMGLLLFYRTKKKLVLSEEGKAFLERADEMMEKMDCFYKAVADISAKKQKHLRICIPQTIIACLFPKLWIDFTEAYPNVKLEIFEMPAIKALESIVDNSIDVGIIIIDEVLDDCFESRVIFETAIELCVSSGHVLANKKMVEVEDVKDLPIILFHEGSCHRRAVEKLYEEKNFKPNVLLHSGQLYTIRNFIENDIAVAFLMRNLFIGNPNIVSIPLKDPVKMKVGLVWKKNKYTSRTVGHLIQVMQDGWGDANFL